MSLYDKLRHFADGYGLIAIMVVFAGLCLWTLRPGAKRQGRIAANSIFEEDKTGTRDDDGQ
ncbi:MAG: cbb3-type cytochrome c oxidase subunit 3 [Altererythrobacter sp.]|nr:cbb3-type cytochrome c oxidase subunit 3 [Altererythrobacter sp.]